MANKTSVKVLIISGSLPPIKCGVGYYTSRLLPALHAQSSPLEYTVVTGPGADALPDTETLFVDGWGISSIPMIIKKIKTAQPDIIHLQYPAVGYGKQLGINFLGYALRPMRHRRLIVTLHEYHQSRLVGRIRNLFTIIPYHEVMVSNGADVLALKRFKRNLRTVPIASNLPDGDESKSEQLVSRLGIDPTHKTLCFFGFPFPNKGIETLLDAAVQLGDYQVLLMSDRDPSNPYHVEIQKRVDRAVNAGVKVTWTGFLSNDEAATVLAYKSPHFFYVYPQDSPITAKAGTIISAAINGQLIIAKNGTATQTSPYIHKSNSYLLSDIGARNIVEAIRELEKDEELQDKIRSKAKELKTYFSWEQVGSKHVEMYKEIAS